MVEGVTYQGFLMDSNKIVKKTAMDSKSRNSYTNSMLEAVGAHILENSGGIPEKGFKGVVQFVHTLFEAAAAATNAAQVEGEDAAKLKQLYDHAMEGLNMIGEEEMPYSSDVDYSSDEN